MAAIFGTNNTNKEVKQQEIDKISNASTNIGKGATLSGNIDTFGNVRIDGKLVGDINSKSKVATGNASLVEGSITAQNAEIEGEVKGSLEISEILVLKSTAIVQGDIIANKLVVETGALFNGKCQMGDVAQLKKNKMIENTSVVAIAAKTENQVKETKDAKENTILKEAKV
jgi:cytoskeletal protein CcmA (bactofilin family)